MSSHGFKLIIKLGMHSVRGWLSILKPIKLIPHLVCTISIYLAHCIVGEMST
jgi:hypothetical protein